MPSSTQDYHVNSQFKMGGGASGGAIGVNSVVGTGSGSNTASPTQVMGMAPATPRMMGKAFVSVQGSSGGTQQTQNSQQLMPPAEINESYSASQTRLNASQRQPPKPFHRKSLGDWDFLETVGAGSMGKVKLAKHRYTNELCAIKIVNRATKSFIHKQQQQQLPPPSNEEELMERRKKLEKEISRDKRTIREASLGQILYHPHICRLFEMCTMSNHFYMLFEYVSGGQLLDYIIQHGSLRERHARKFARGIASALQYLHMNNIVHRDLKIENIMISSSGEIRIIDFGLSNLYDPKKQLHTFCGSLYFAAPELLKAHPYTGPEVDIWSFGVVLYVLVCGKVPFDDENASVLHEKIKQGKVEYPQHLSIDVISLLSKMLVVDPLKRATLKQVVNHQWMQKGYDFPPPSYLPQSVPLTSDLINMDVIKEMHRLELIQDVDDTLQWLEKIVNSEGYLELSGEYWSDVQNNKLEDDPTRAFNPLLSIYHLVDEMLKRKRSKIQKKIQLSGQQEPNAAVNSAPPTATTALVSAGTMSAGSFTSTATAQQKVTTGVSASGPEQATRHSGPSTTGPQPTVQSHIKNGVSQTISANTLPIAGTFLSYAPSPTTPSKHKRKILVPPKLAIPEQAHTTTPRKDTEVVEQDAEHNVLSPTPQSHDIETNNNQYVNIGNGSTHSTAASASSNEKQNFSSLFRRFSQRHRYTNSQGSSQQGYTQDSNTLQQSPKYTNQVSTISQSLQVAKSKKSHTRTVSEYAPTSKYSSLGPTAPTVDSKTSYAESQSPLPALPSNAETLVKEQQILQSTLQDLDISATRGSSSTNHGHEAVDEEKPLKQLNIPKGRKLHPSARAKSVGHSRRESLKFMRPAVATQVSPQDFNDDGFLENISDSKSDIMFGASSSNGALSGVDEELTDKQILKLASRAPPGSMPSVDYPRSLFLKGFFSVQTTSSKPLPIVRYKIISTLKKLNIEFKEVKGGFICVHRQSYVTKKYSVVQQPSIVVTESNSVGSVNNPGSGAPHRRQLSISSRYGSIRRQQSLVQPNIPNTPLAAALQEKSQQSTLQSFGAGCGVTEDLSTASLESLNGDDNLTNSKAQYMNSKDLEMQYQKERPPLRFEIHIVKVRIVGLAGVHFKKVSGNTWMYKELASHILKELNL
ncbi:serine/threonine protein kinase KIN1 Ecym_4291 [Eremothecium cymbalariae DBVPG|uniref:non-specific serine/threonine protein kinase n=1 Tax=Eremothecium cymbalariae (strain CBS 270.75 / DBVPG 7215 / KCTC 17166 / NRRL Y-17582) TaxID=931890 RepID=G8JTK1_ERECY|nr:hypothetical protein Ecym_4291 [Eremothecium cymbalariae DBVPG\